MKKIFINTVPSLLCALVLLGSTPILHAQSNNNMGIGTTSPDASAILDIKSTTKGLLIPRLTQGQENVLSGPSGLLIYNSDQNRFNYYNGGWKPVGLWSATGNNIYFNTGNVGIGTSTPTTAKLVINRGSGLVGLDLASTDAYAEMRVIRNSLFGSDNNLYLGFGAASGANTYLYSGGTNPVMTLTGGNVGVTGSISANGGLGINNGSPTLTLQDTDNRSGFIHVNDGLMYFLNSASNNATTWALNGSYWPLHLNLSNDAATFGGPAYFMEGNVGIGTSNPLTQLSISPNVTEPKITLWDGNSTVNHYGFGVSGGQLNYHVDGASSSHVFYAGGKNGNGTELMRIAGNGNVGIGISPAHKLHVAGVVGISNWTIQQNFASNDLTFTSPNGSQAAISVNGVYFNSDRRLKENIKPLGSVLSKLMMLEAKNYNMIADPKKELAIGFIAQEVEPLFPEFICASSGDDELNSFYKMNYAGMGVIAVKAIQEQQQIIEAQAKKIQAQQAEIDTIKKALEKAGIKLD